MNENIIIDQKFELNQCLDWILENGYKKIALQLKLECLQYSTAINNYLKEESLKRGCKEPIDLYITQSSTCCVDLIVTQHVSNLDALIHFGNVCLVKPIISNEATNLPVFFAFGIESSNDKFNNNIKLIIDKINTLKESYENCKICIFYDTCFIQYANKLSQLLESDKEDDNIDIAKLYCPDKDWTTTKVNLSKFLIDENSNKQDLNLFGFYNFKRPIDQYTCGIYLGNNLSIYHTVEGPKKLLQFNCDNGNFENVETSKALNRRIALVERLKDEIETNIGVIITNPLPNIANIMERLENYSKPRKHRLYFISMIQTIDECKIGNFDLCDSFVIINSCNCSTILKSLIFNRPILTELEYKLACGFKAKYGRILWPGSSSNLTEEDMINKRKVSDVSVALVQTRNELLERCSQARTNKWSGLEYGGNKATVGDEVLGKNSCNESLKIEEGLKGIASSYISEPLTKIDVKKGDVSESHELKE